MNHSLLMRFYSKQVFFRFFLAILSLIIVAFGQPVWSSFLSIVSATCGFALFWIATDSLQNYKSRFWAGTLWFTGIHLIQYVWTLSHPYAYIYPIWLIGAFLLGFPFGLLNGWMSRSRVSSVLGCLTCASIWITIEWLRLYILSGVSWNPIGLALSAWLIPLQMASLAGAFGMSFVVFLTNVLFYRTYLFYKEKREFKKSLIVSLSVLLFPYVFGAGHLMFHLPRLQETVQTQPSVKVLLVQTGFSVDEVMALKDPLSTLSYTFEKWKQVVGLLRDQQEKADLVVLPEHVVPYGTYYPIFPIGSVQLEFRKVFGDQVLALMPEKEMHLAAPIETESGNFWMVNNAYWVQSLSNVLDAEVVAGLEDTENFFNKPNESYTSAMVFFPKSNLIERYDKRVLVPLGEYIPFEWCRNMARGYGVMSSFTPGTTSKVIDGKVLPYGLSVCYEETFGELMGDNRRNGAEMLVNITNDFWYPNSMLPRQHFDHARLRTVEMGIPLVRSANSGVTGAFNSLGQVIGTLAQEEENPEAASGALLVNVPRYSYTTIYTFTGDLLPLSMAWSIILCFFASERAAFFRRRLAQI